MEDQNWMEPNCPIGRHDIRDNNSYCPIYPVTATYTPDITLLTLAARTNYYEILKILVDRGAAHPQPHDMKCNCDTCMANS